MLDAAVATSVLVKAAATTSWHDRSCGWLWKTENVDFLIASSAAGNNAGAAAQTVRGSQLFLALELDLHASLLAQR
jgi:hypothetical protein